MKLARVLLVVICIALFCSESFGDEGTNIWSESTNYDGAISNAPIDWNTRTWALCIGPVTIYTDGTVRLDEGVSKEEAARAFWKAVYEAYPGMFINKVPTWK